MKKTLLFIILILAANSFFSFAPVKTFVVNGQRIDKPKAYPKNYFRNPLQIPIQLAANFGELRTNHYHMGLDIRTNQRENLPVVAAAEGYVSRVKIERYGFGRAIYIDHPNGFTTVYAHLNDFYNQLNDYVIEKQYNDESWEQDITFEAGQFPVKKGQFIAYSGNTGGSQGPHLHFEIRDTQTEDNINPWLFDFGLPDRIPPQVYRLYYYDRRYSTYQVGPTPIAIKGSAGTYAATANVVSLHSPKVSFGLAAVDKYNGSSFRLGIYSASLEVDDVPVASFVHNEISYNNTRYINASIDYKTKATGGGYIQHLSQLPGNNLDIFSGSDNGTITVNDTGIHHAKITVTDVSGNKSVVAFNFRWSPAATKNHLFPANAVPFIPNKFNQFNTEDFQIELPESAIYDTVPFVHIATAINQAGTVSAIHKVHNPAVPVHTPYTIRIKPTNVIADQDKDKVIMHLQSNRKTETISGEWKGDWIEGKFRDFGSVKLVVDKTPPTVAPIGWTPGSSVRGKKSIVLVAKDNVTEISDFAAYLDGKWLMFSRSGNSFIHRFDNRTAAGKHQLRVIVKDLAGNTTEKTYTFTR